MKIKNNSLIIEGNELIPLETMLEDLPSYLSASGVQLSAISSLQRKEILQKIKIIFEMMKGNKQQCQKCWKESNIFHGDYGELLCPSCYSEVTEEENK